MWDLDTIKRINSKPVFIGTPGKQALDSARVYDIGTDANGNAKYALGNKGHKAMYVVRRVTGVGRPKYEGVQARRPRISETAKLVPREGASKLLLAALGLR